MRKTVLSIFAILALGLNALAQSDSLDLGYGLRLSKAESSVAADAVTYDNIAVTGGFNVMNALYGLIPGLQVQEGGTLSYDNGPSLYVRGRGSHNGNAVMVLVDGIERDPAYINPEEVENITVLKDAAGIALYGNRGADGVILITTKRGQNKNGLFLKADYTLGVQTPFRIPEMASASEYTSAVNEALANDGLAARYTDGMEIPDVDWRKEVLKGAAIDHDLNIAIDGVDTKAKYYILANYHGNSGLMRYYNDMSSLKLRANLDIQMTPTTQVQINMMGRIMQYESPIAGASLSTMYDTPAAAFPIKHDDYWVRSTNFSNPLAVASADGYTTTLQRALFADLSIKQDLSGILSGLKAEGRIAYDNSANIADGRSNSYQYYTYDYDGTYTLYGTDTQMTFSTYLATQFMRYTLWGKLSYDKSFGDHNLKAAFIYDQTKIKYRGANNSSLYRDYILNGIYDYKGKYFATATLSYSGSARLQTGHKYRIYPAVSAAWLMSAEPWFNAPKVNSLKVRASAGITGFDSRLYYDMDKQFNGGGNSYVFFGTTSDSGLGQGDLPSDNILPETDTKLNLGVEAKMFDCLSVQLDAFYNHRRHIMSLASGEYSSVIGLGLPYIFDGETVNRGVELAANYRKTIGEISYNAGVTLSLAKDKITKISEEYHPYDYMNREGHSIDAIYWLTADGFYQESDFNADGSLKDGVPVSSFVTDVQPGDVKYKDLNGDGKIDSYDFSYEDKGILPNFYYGFTLGLSYHKFGFEAIFNGAAGVTSYTNLSSIYQPLYGDAANISKHYLDNYWTSDRTNAKYPRLTTLSNNNNQQTSSVWTEKGGYFKLRNLYVYYDIKAPFISKMKMSQCRVFLRGNNLFSVDSIKILDPEVISTGYPSVRSYQVGLKCSF